MFCCMPRCAHDPPAGPSLPSRTLVSPCALSARHTEQVLSRLYMADFGGRNEPSGLYMAPILGYRRYARWNSNAHTRDIAVYVPYISHLAESHGPNLPYISQVAFSDAGTGPSGLCTRLPRARISDQTAPRTPYAAIAGHNMAVICFAHCASCAWHSAL